MASLELVWVEDFETVTSSAPDGAFDPDGDEIDGLSLELYGEMNLSEITNEMLIDRMEVKISIAAETWLETLDRAGWQHQQSFLGHWNMEWLQPEFIVLHQP